MFSSVCFALCRKAVSSFLVVSLVVSSEFSYAQGFAASLPQPGHRMGVSEMFTPVLIKGLVVHPDKPLNFDFIVDSGNDTAQQAVVKEQSEKMVKYFLAALTVPEGSLWVNLSPYEKDRIIDDSLGNTVLGRDMLAQDYLLKQLSASFMYPEEGLGKEFWAKIYKQAQERFGTTDIPVDTFNKVWIMPDKAEVFEKGTSVYVTRAHLKIMLDTDYNVSVEAGLVSAQSRADMKPAPMNEMTKSLIRQIILPAIEKEVNEGKNFATLRQVYHAAILAKWYRGLVQDTLMSRFYVGTNKINGVIPDEQALKEQIYQRYIAAYKQGVFDYIKEEADPATGRITPKRYFSGGLDKFGNIELDKAQAPDGVVKVGKIFQVDFVMDKTDPSQSVLVTSEEALQYQEEIRNIFASLDEKAFFRFVLSEDAEVFFDRNNKGGSVESLFHHIVLERDQPVRRIYKEVQQIVNDAAGPQIAVSDIDLKEIHVTIATDDEPVGVGLTLTLDQLLKDLKEDVQGVGAFEITLVGPHLMPDGVIVMEYTTTAPAFLYLRNKAADRRYARVLSATNRASAPAIMHSTVSVIKDTKVSREVLRDLQVRLNAYRAQLSPVTVLVDRIAVTHFSVNDRRFIESKEILLGVPDIQTTAVALSADVPDAAMINEVMQFFQNNLAGSVVGIVATVSAAVIMARNWWRKNTVIGNWRRASDGDIGAIIWLIHHTEKGVVLPLLDKNTISYKSVREALVQNKNKIFGRLGSMQQEQFLRDFEGKLLQVLMEPNVDRRSIGDLLVSFDGVLGQEIKVVMNRFKERIRDSFGGDAEFLFYKFFPKAWPFLSSGGLYRIEYVPEVAEVQDVEIPYIIRTQTLYSNYSSDTTAETVQIVAVYDDGYEALLKEEFGTGGRLTVTREGEAPVRTRQRRVVVSEDRLDFIAETSYALSANVPDAAMINEVSQWVHGNLGWVIAGSLASIAVAIKMLNLWWTKRADRRKALLKAQIDSSWKKMAADDAKITAISSIRKRIAPEFWGAISDEDIQKVVRIRAEGKDFLVTGGYQEVRAGGGHAGDNGSVVGAGNKSSIMTDNVPVIDIVEVFDKAQINGGVDIKSIDVNRTGGVRIKFDDAVLRQIFDGSFNGFTPVFIKMTLIENPLMILGAVQREQEGAGA